MPLNDPILVHWLDGDLLLRLGAAAAIGLVLGLDRELRGHAAGMRTHGLICFASAAMTVSIVALYGQLAGERMDPLRIYEATGAFIGIIGAGLIVFSKGEVKNVTTAAHLWVTAVIGVACIHPSFEGLLALDADVFHERRERQPLLMVGHGRHRRWVALQDDAQKGRNQGERHARQ